MESSKASPARPSSGPNAALPLLKGLPMRSGTAKDATVLLGIDGPETGEENLAALPVVKQRPTGDVYQIRNDHFIIVRIMVGLSRGLRSTNRGDRSRRPRSSTGHPRRNHCRLNLREVAQLSAVSPAQASRILPGLVDLGVVERREVPPSSQFRLVREHTAARSLISLAHATDNVLGEIGRMASAMPNPPASVIVFGSFARREARTDSDIDVLVVRPTDIDEDDEGWANQLDDWRNGVGRLTGNAVEIVEYSPAEIETRLDEGSDLLRQVSTDGLLILGSDLASYRRSRSA